MWWKVTKARIEVDEARKQVVAQLQCIVELLNKRHDQDLERIDRLMEALARKAGVDLIMPTLPLPPTEKVHVPNPWKDPNLVTDKFPASESAGNAGTGTPKFAKEAVK